MYLRGDKSGVFIDVNQVDLMRRVFVSIVIGIKSPKFLSFGNSMTIFTLQMCKSAIVHFGYRVSETLRGVMIGAS